jgi:hypothetical protein
MMVSLRNVRSLDDWTQQVALPPKEISSGDSKV